MAEKMGISEADDPELDELSEPIKPQNILKEMDTKTLAADSPPKSSENLGDNGS